MNRKYLVFFVGAAIVYVIYHLFTLIYSPFPWFDEVTFSSMTESYIKHHTLYEEARIIVVPEQKLNYGPIYFVWQAMVIKALGLSIFNFRISNLLFGFIDLYLIYLVCRQLKFTLNAAIIAVVLIALEPNFNQFLHSGRMDYMSLFFFFLAYLAFGRIDFGRKYMPALFGLATGILLACSILTTPRIIFAFSVYVCYFFYEIITGSNKKNVLLKYLLIGVGFAAIYYLWIYVTFGTVANYIYTSTHASYMKDHVGMGTRIAIRYNLFIILYAFLAFFILVKNKIVTKYIDLVLFTMPAIVAFIVIVTGGISGRYFALVLPFTVLLIVAISIKLYNNKLLKYSTYTIAVLFALVFVFKGVYILGTLPQHDPYLNEKIISQYLTPNTSVAGDFHYYYIARDNNCSFLSLDFNGPEPEKIKYFLDHKVQYVIINKDSYSRQSYEEGFLKDHYQLVTHLEDKNYSSFFARIMKKLPYRIADSYSCYIYKYKG